MMVIVLKRLLIVFLMMVSCCWVSLLWVLGGSDWFSVCNMFLCSGVVYCMLVSLVWLLMVNVEVSFYSWVICLLICVVMLLLNWL